MQDVDLGGRLQGGGVPDDHTRLQTGGADDDADDDDDDDGDDDDDYDTGWRKALSRERRDSMRFGESECVRSLPYYFTKCSKK